MYCYILFVTGRSLYVNQNIWGDAVLVAERERAYPFGSEASALDFAREQIPDEQVFAVRMYYAPAPVVPNPCAAVRA